MKKVRLFPVLALSAVAMAGLMGCNNDGNKMKVGLICLHPASSSTYDKNFVEAFKASAKKLGFKAVIRENIPEDDKCQTTAENLAETGCKVIFADSFGHEDYMIEAAKKYPNVQFCHATGTRAGGENVPSNFHNAFASIYEGRYLAGVVAGKKLEAMKAANPSTSSKIGYVAAHAYAEVISGYTSFYLGVKSIVSDVTMDVRYTDNWYHEADEKAAANALIQGGCVLISQHADSYGAPTACEEAGVPNVSYNGSTATVAKETFLVSSKINWSPYYEYVVNKVMAVESPEQAQIEANWSGGFAEGSVELSELGKNVAEGTAEKVAEVKAQLANGSLKVFDTSKFTIGGAAPSEENMAPNKQWTFNYPDGMEFIKDGYYHESEYRSAPSFDKIIDGINELGHMHPQED
jgi:basic membrane protein A